MIKMIENLDTLRKQNNISWSESYWNQIERNIGYVTFKEQEILRKAHIVVFGSGGLGGPISEQLVRTGVENISICDYDTFDESNLNRQICTKKDIGAYKVDILKRLLKNINPNVKVKKYYEVNEKNVSRIIINAKVVILGLDGPLGSIIIARECRRQQIPMLESWIIPILWSWWFTIHNITYEHCYDLNTEDLTIEEIKNTEFSSMKSTDILFPKILNFPGVKQLYDRQQGVFEATNKSLIGIRTMAPLVRLGASYLAFDTIFSGILNIKPMVLAPHVIGFDLFKMQPVDFSIK